MFRVNNFDKLLDKATSNLRLDPDWPTILQICDLIRQNDCTPKYAVAAIKKKLYSPNPHQAMFALLTLESVVKNCGSGIHDEVASKAFCESLRDLVKTTQHENLRNKILDLIQAWAFAFRNNTKYRAVQDTVNILKAEGFKFPPLKESDAMFSADTAPEWADGEVCHRCRVAFSLIVRRHHCRACGQVFCQQCSSKTSTLPKFGIEKEVRVCDACFDKVSRPPPATTKLDIVDTSSDYGPTQPQKRPPGGKTAEELQEEEELQLALALSQSEAEEKEKVRGRFRGHLPPPETSHRTVSPTPSSVSASPEHSVVASNATSSEMSRYLDRSYWEQRLARETAAPTAPTSSVNNDTPELEYANIERQVAANKGMADDAEDKEIDEFVETLKSQVEIFVNRMKSNSSRGRSIANDTSVQTLFMNITAMHSRLLRYIQQQDDKRVYLESLQDKVNQVRDSRAALDTLRAEHAARLAAQAEAAERQRQMQMASKLQAMRKKKHEYLQYQRQLALQRVQEQEREMQMRQEQQKHQYMMTANSFYMPNVSMHQFQPGYPNQPIYATAQFHPQMMAQPTTDGSMPMTQPQMTSASIPGLNQHMANMSVPQLTNNYTMPQSGLAVSQAPISAQPSMNQQNMRNQQNINQQMQMPQQMLMQQMHQMRMQQPNMHQVMSQNISMQNGQSGQLPKHTLSQSHTPTAMMSTISLAGQTMPQALINQNNPILNMQMQNMRMPLMQGQNQLPGYPMNMQNQNQQQNPQNLQQSLPGQPNSLPGQPIMQTMSMPTQPQSLQMPNNMPQSSQSVQQPGGQIPQTQQSQAQMVHSQSMPIHGQQMQHPGQQMMMSAGQPMTQGQQVIGQGQMQGSQMSQLQNMSQLPQTMQQSQPLPQNHTIQQVQQVPQGQNLPPGQNMGQGPPGQQLNQVQQMTQAQQMPQGQQVPQTQQMPQGQQIPQGQQLPQSQQMAQGQQMPQGQPMSQGQQMPQAQPMSQGQAMPPQGQPMNQGQQMSQGQPLHHGQQMQGQQPQDQMQKNVPGQGQPMKQPQNFSNGPPGQTAPQQGQGQTQGPLSMKNERNASTTAELISFD